MGEMRLQKIGSIIISYLYISSASIMAGALAAASEESADRI